MLYILRKNSGPVLPCWVVISCSNGRATLRQQVHNLRCRIRQSLRDNFFPYGSAVVSALQSWPRYWTDEPQRRECRSRPGNQPAPDSYAYTPGIEGNACHAFFPSLLKPVNERAFGIGLEKDQLHFPCPFADHFRKQLLQRIQAPRPYTSG